jgi:hypothetical protein
MPEQADPADLETLDTGEIQDLAAAEIEDLSPRDFDQVTGALPFRRATAKLLAGEMNVPEWEKVVARELTDCTEIPYLPEAAERGVFDQAIKVLGDALEALLAGGSGRLDRVTSDQAFRGETLKLIQGKTSVPEWMNSLGDALNQAVDVPYIPEMAEDIAFEKGMEVLGSALHGFLDGGTENIT